MCSYLEFSNISCACFNRTCLTNAIGEYPRPFLNELNMLLVLVSVIAAKFSIVIGLFQLAST